VSAEKQYLGDGVYAELDDYGRVLLTTEGDGYDRTNAICLEPEVIAALRRYLEDVKR
jgi:hypothetical protein